jgi:hypothetical protein
MKPIHSFLVSVLFIGVLMTLGNYVNQGRKNALDKRCVDGLIKANTLLGFSLPEHKAKEACSRDRAKEGAGVYEENILKLEASIVEYEKVFGVK